MIQFFHDLINLTPLQHLIKYWFAWLIFVLVCYGIVKFINKKPE